MLGSEKQKSSSAQVGTFKSITRLLYTDDEGITFAVLICSRITELSRCKAESHTALIRFKTDVLLLMFPADFILMLNSKCFFPV